jgi:hypothetical protein
MGDNSFELLTILQKTRLHFEISPTNSKQSAHGNNARNQRRARDLATIRQRSDREIRFRKYKASLPGSSEYT